MQVQKTKSDYKLVKSFFGKQIEIPEDWNLKKLREMADSDSDIVAGPFGSNLKVSDYTQDGIPLVRLQNIERNRFVDENIVFIGKEKAEELKYHSFKGGDLLLAKLGDPIGKTCEVPQKIKNGILVGDVVRIRISSSKAYKTLVEYFLNSKQGLIQFNREKIGTTRPRINLSHVRNLTFPFPSSIVEQQKIASILSNVDSLISRYDKVIEQTKVLKTGLMQKLFTKGIGHTKFKKIKWLFGKEMEIPENWSMLMLKDLTDKIGDGIHSTPNYVDDSDFYFINGNNLINGLVCYFDNTKNVNEEEYLKYKLDLNEKTVFLSINGTLCNVAFYDNEKIVLGKSVCYINCNEKLNKKFLFYVLQSHYLSKFFGRELTGTTISNLSLATVRNSPLLLPKIEEQEKIASILTTFDKRVDELEYHKSNLQTLKKGLMQKLLTGQIRVNVGLSN